MDNACVFPEIRPARSSFPVRVLGDLDRPLAVFVENRSPCMGCRVDFSRVFSGRPAALSQSGPVEERAWRGALLVRRERAGADPSLLL